MNTTDRNAHPQLSPPGASKWFCFVSHEHTPSSIGVMIGLGVDALNSSLSGVYFGHYFLD
jgi:hypothetical protein